MSMLISRDSDDRPARTTGPMPPRPGPVVAAGGTRPGAATPGGVAEPSDHFAVAVPTGVAFVGVRVYRGAAAGRAVAGPGETLRRVGRSVALVFYYSGP